MSEETKKELINNIKEWIKLDNEITKMKTEMKEKNDKKKKLTDSLVVVMKNSAIDCFDINGGSLIYKQTKVKQTINKKTLLTALQTYYKTEPLKVEEIVEHVLNTREEKIKETIRLKSITK
jgi:hypothetical protein